MQTLEGELWLARSGNHPSDRWTRRALSHLDRNLSDLRSPGLYTHTDRYRQRVMEVNRVISSPLDPRFRLSLADYSDSSLTPVKSGDLLLAAETFFREPLFFLF